VVLSDPAPITGPVPLRYDHTFGGRDAVTGEVERHNPIGRGFASDPQRLDGALGPQLETAQAGLQPDGAAKVAAAAGVATAHPSSATFAPVPASWEPRTSRGGTHDMAWAKNRAPVRPRDFDRMHFSWAAAGLHSAAPLAGDEPVEVGGVLEEGVWRFRLPSYGLAFESERDGVRTSHDAHLDGFLIDSDKRRVELTWRTSIPLPRKWELLSRIFVSGVGELPRQVTGAPAPTTEQASPRASLSAAR
jgi:hypothetical protein